MPNHAEADQKNREIFRQLSSVLGKKNGTLWLSFIDQKTASAISASSTIYQQGFTGSGAMAKVNWSALAVRDLPGTNVDVSEYTGRRVKQLCFFNCE